MERTEEVMLSRWALGACLALWSVEVAAAGANAPNRFPYLPHLAQDRVPEICRALEAAEQESFKSANATVSAIDRPWPGLDVTWAISPATIPGETGNLLLAHVADLDGDGRSEILALMSQVHSWRGNIFSLARFASDDDFKAFEARTDKSSPGKGESLLVRSSGGDTPFPWDWDIPGVLTVNGQYYLLDEGPVWGDLSTATLYRIPATGKPEAICTIERRPSRMEEWESKIGVAQLVSDLSSIVGGSGWCGTLNPEARNAIAARRVRTMTLLRPWAAVLNNNQPSVDPWLAKWATDGVWNWALYNQFKSDEPNALQFLTAWYAEAFGIADAEQEARRVMDLVIRAHFSFPSALPKVSPLAAALLRGAPVTEVAPLLTNADLNQPKFVEGASGADAPLVLAVKHPHLVQLLLNEGAPVNSSNSFGKTPLMYAAQVDKAESVRLLLASGAEVNARTRSANLCELQIRRGNRTPLHYAAENAGLEVIRLLVDAGAEVGAHDKEDGGGPSQTPLDYLSRNIKLSDEGRQEAIHLLSTNR
jgi:hypothetical protein